MRFFAVALVLLAVAPAAHAATATRLTEERATEIALAHPKVRDWLERYPPNPTTAAELDKTGETWTVRVWSGEAGQIAEAKIDDATALVTEAWTGPQAAWKMARGGRGAFGGRQINSTGVWLAFCLAFLLGLADFRRPLSVRNLDLLVLLSFGISLYYFNEGEIFTSVPLAYPPLVYLLARMTWIGFRGRAQAWRPLLPFWVLAAAAVFLGGFRVGLNLEDGNVIDVGFAGVIGAHRIVHGEAPYGHMPTQHGTKPCGPADAEGEIRERIQTNGRCEASNDRGDTYGPVSYLAYVPGYLAFGWTGKWDDLPAAHATTVLFDLLCFAGLALIGWRFGGAQLASVLAFAWVAYPFTQYASSSNTNDSIPPAFLIWGFWLATSPWARGAAVALSGWTKFASFVAAPLWMSFPDRRRPLAFAGGFVAATLVSFLILLLEPSLWEAVKMFFERTLGFQLDRRSPFSLWEWRQYHADGIPDLHLVQDVLQVLVVGFALALYFVPRRKSPLQLAALTAAVLIAFELVLTHWFYLYIPWFFPFVAIALLLPFGAAVTVEPPKVVDERDEARAPVAVA